MVGSAARAPGAGEISAVEGTVEGETRLERFRRWVEGQRFTHEGATYRVKRSERGELFGVRPRWAGATHDLALDWMDPAHPIWMRLYRRFEREEGEDT